MEVMKRFNAQQEFATVSLHKEKRFLEPRYLIQPDNRTAHTQMLTLHLARKNVGTFSIPRSLFLSVNLTGAGLSFNVTGLRRTVGAWTVAGMRSLVLEVLIVLTRKHALIPVCISLP
ncbi:hypothetical protein OS493_004686 [Desmophyllum pertusum]|uniref:Uncharacterized protein n=1 Tax=Desmophyllum pertusum TaxID=174260 RepID=A0A9X0D0D4_9CNID|nr:hypothetical protein OS493_004686 [Desmophyllum pertusum]